MRLLLGLLICWTITSCKTTEYTPDSYEKRQIIFGNGGGFTGAVDTYVLLENGQLFNERSIAGSTYKSLPALDKTVTKQIFDNYDALSLSMITLNDPGDLYYFVKMKTPDSQYALTWGGFNQKVDPIVNRFYMNLFQLAQRQKKLTSTK